MTRHTLTFAIEADTPQKATALREKLAELLEADEDVTLINRMSSEDEQRFRVLGVDGTDRFDETVSAKDVAAAEAKAVGTSKSKLVAVVLPMP